MLLHFIHLFKLNFFFVNFCKSKSKVQHFARQLTRCRSVSVFSAGCSISSCVHLLTRTVSLEHVILFRNLVPFCVEHVAKHQRERERERERERRLSDSRAIVRWWGRTRHLPRCLSKFAFKLLKRHSYTFARHVHRFLFLFATRVIHIHFLSR
jgi:hypothetical protein